MLQLDPLYKAQIQELRILYLDEPSHSVKCIYKFLT